MLFRVLRLLSTPELAPREAYQLWSKTYPPHAHNLLMEVEERAVCDLLPSVASLRVLDLASGSGRYSRVLIERGACPLATDFSYEMLAQGDATLSRAQSDMNAIPLRDNSVAVIVCGLAVGHVANLQAVLDEMARVLMPHGILVYSDFHSAGEARGWKRTFRASGRTFAVKHYSRTDDEHAAAVIKAGLALETLAPVYITAKLAQTDNRAMQFRAQWGNTPVALVVRAHKP